MRKMKQSKIAKPCCRSPSDKNKKQKEILTTKDIIELMYHDSYSRNRRGAIVSRNNRKVVK